MRTQSFRSVSIETLNKELGQSMANFQATLAIVFTSVKHDLQAISAVFKEYEIDLVACTTAGEIIDTEVVAEEIVVLLMDMDRSNYQINLESSESIGTYEAALKTAKKAENAFAKPAIIILSGGMSTDGEEIIKGIKHNNKNIPIYGGLAGDDIQFVDTWVFSHSEVSKNGLLALIIDTEKIKVDGLAISGWKGIGNIYEITKCEGNVVYEINNEPALDFFFKYFGFYLNESNVVKSDDDIETISGQYPLQMIRDNNLVARSILTVDHDKKSLFVAGGVENGEKFRFSIAPGFEVIDQSLIEFASFKTDSNKADALILVSCKGRQTAFGPMIENEVEGIHELWDAPLVGFLSYGEIGKKKGADCQLHNVTSTLVTLTEI